MVLSRKWLKNEPVFARIFTNKKTKKRNPALPLWLRFSSPLPVVSVALLRFQTILVFLLRFQKIGDTLQLSSPFI